MLKRYYISSGTDILKSTRNNIFTQTELPKKNFSFSERKNGGITPAYNDTISLERRRRYNYYEEE